MASGTARGRVRTTTTVATESRHMAAILQILGWSETIELYHTMLKQKILPVQPLIQ